MGSAQVGVAIPRMTDEFPCSLRQASQRLPEKGSVVVVVIANQRASLNHSQHTIGRKQSGALGPLQELSRKSMQHPDLAITLPELRLAFEQARRQRFDRNNRIADGPHAANPCGAEQRSENFRKDVGVLVGIEVRYPQTGRLNLPDLRRDFFHQLVAIEASKHGARSKRRKAGVKLFRFGGAHCHQCVQRPRLCHRRSIHENNMASHGKIRRRPRRDNRILERQPIGHQGRRGDNASRVGFENGSIHSSGQTEIIGVYD